MKKAIYLTLLIILVYSCVSTKTPESSYPKISIDDNWDSDDFVKLSEIATSVEYIALEKTPECILPEELQLECSIVDKFIFVTQHDEPVNVFNLKGKYLFKVGRIGQGPGEYIRSKVAYDSENKLIWILDGNQNKLIKFNDKGIYLNEFKCQQGVFRIAVNKGHLYSLNLKGGYGEQPDESSVQVWNLEGEIIKVIPLPEDRDPGAGAFGAIHTFFDVSKNKIHFNESPYNSSYYLDNKDKWQKSMSIDQGSQAVKPEAYKNGSYLNECAILKCKITPNFCFLGGMKKRQVKQFVYDFRSGILKPNHIMAETEDTRDIWGVFNDYDGGLPFWPNGNAGNNSYAQINDALRYIDLAEGKLKYWGTDKVSPISSELKTFCQNLNPEDNPVIMRVTLK